MGRLLIILFMLALPPGLSAQGFLPKYNKDNRPDSMYRLPRNVIAPEIKNKILNFEIINGDTVFFDNLKEIKVIYRPANWKKSKAWRQYYRLVWNFKKVYPYALKAKEITLEADSVIQHSNFTKRERDKYINQYEKRLFKEFEKPLRNLTFSQGKLLLKLLDRELGRTSFYVIKGYKGGITAGFWQGVAKLFGSDLKKPYDKYGEDKNVEELVEMYHQGTFDYLYYSMFNK